MALMNSRRWVATGVALGLGLAGCASDAPKRGQTYMPKASARPLNVPPTRDVALDPALASAAQNELGLGLRAPDPLMRMHALEILRETSRNGQADKILQALGDRDPGVRFAAAMTAGELRLESARRQLLLLATDPSMNVRVGARYALHRLGDTRLSHDLEKTARDPDKYVRRDTALVLGLLGETSALNVLRPMRLDSDPGVRQQVLESMWRLGDEAVLEDLVALTLSQFPDDQMFGLLALAAPRIGRVRRHIEGKLTEDYPRIALVAARALGTLGSDRGYGVALKGASSKDPEERFYAARALGAIGRPDAQSTLAQLLKDPDAHVRLVAAASILQLAQPQAQAVAR